MRKLSKESIEERLYDLIGDFTMIDKEDLKSESKLIEDLGIDSLGKVDLCIKVEDEFSTRIPDSEWDRTTEIGQIIDLVYDKLNVRD